MLDAADAHEPFFELTPDEPAVFARPAEELLALALEFRGVGGAGVPVEELPDAFASARRACACASSEETFGCKERMRRWFFA